MMLRPPANAAEVLVYQQRLTDAETAYHSLMLGGAVRVVVDQNGERVEYTAPNKASLWSYILALQGALGMPIRVSAPMRPML